MKKIGAIRLDAFEKWLAVQGKSLNTIKTYLGVLERFDDWLEQEQSDGVLSRDDVQSYLDFLESQMRSAATIEKVFAAISVFCYFENTPSLVEDIRRKEKVKVNEAPDSLEPNERKKLLKEVEKDGNLRNTAIVYTLLHTGIRISELCGLNKSDIELTHSRGQLAIRDTSGETQRVIPLSNEAQFHLTQHLKTLPDHCDAVFLSRGNNRMTSRAVQYMLKKYNVNPHKLRHTFCKELVQKGIDIETVAKLAGHSDINVTKRYKKSSPIFEQAIDKTFA